MNISQELKTLLESVDLSEDTAIKLKLLVTEAVQEKVAEYEDQITELKEQANAYGESIRSEYEEQIDELKEQANAYGESIRSEYEEQIDELKDKAQEYGDYITEELSEKLEQYANYVVEQFVEDTKDSLVKHAEYERIRSAFDTIKEAFENNGFELQESTVSPLEEKLKENLESYNKLFAKYTALGAELQAFKEEREIEKKTALFEDITSQLAETQRERISNLINTMTFKGIDDYKRAVELMVEEVSKKAANKPAKPELVKESIIRDPFEDSSKRMAEYLKRL